MDGDELRRVLNAMEQAGVEYTLVGAVALGMHGIIRGTRDVDLLIKASPENVQRIDSALGSAYQDDPNIGEIRTNELLGDYSVVRYFPQSANICVDLIARIGEVATFESIEAETMEFRGLRIRVATTAALHRLKKSSLRPIDHQDAAALRAGFDLGEDGWMGVQRFRSLEEMNSVPVPRRDSDGIEQFICHNATLHALAPQSLPTGVFNYRSLEEAQRGRDAALAKRRKR